jgi:acyl-CoA synthetase (AMP-forming)/AMP-acid ligase II
MPKLLIRPDMTLYQAIKTVANEFPKRPAVTMDGQTLTYAELLRNVDSMARKLLRLGVKPGDKVALILGNSIDFVYAFFAPSAIGAVMVPLNTVYREREFLHVLSDSEASIVIADRHPMGNNVEGILRSIQPSLPHLRTIVVRGPASDDFLSLAEIAEDSQALKPNEVLPDDLCALVYTSGTTGVPKAVMHSHRSMISAVSQSEARYRRPFFELLKDVISLTRRYDSRFLRWGLKPYTVLAPAPLYHLLGYGALTYGLLYGYRAVLVERFHPVKVLELIQKEHVNVVMTAPTMVSALLRVPEIKQYDLSSLLFVMMGAAPCPPELVRQAREVLGCPIVIAFGATEVGGATLVTNPIRDSERVQTETVGGLLEGMEAKVVDENRGEVPRGEVGELALRLKSTMLGYYKSPETTAQALDSQGWYYTGDLAVVDSQGYVSIVGRKKDMIIRGGQNIYPAEIENFLITKPGVMQVAVVGVPDELTGERIWAYVVPDAGLNLKPAEVIGYCRSELAPHKVPDQVRIIAELPMTSTGKVQKFALRDRALQELAPSK